MRAIFLRILSLPETFLSCLIITLFALISQLDPSFLQWEVQRTLSSHIWELAIIAIPMTLSILTAGSDL